MAAMLNGATCLAWIAGVLGEADIGGLLARIEARGGGPSPVTFLPYLSGERTPHNDPDVRGAFVGLSADTGREDLVRAVLEGVAFSLAEAQAVLEITATAPLPVVGGAARSRFWLKIIASALGRPVLLYAGADKGPAFGAVRLARIAATGESPRAVCLAPDVEEEIAPDPALAEVYGERLATYRALYPAVRPSRGPRADRPPAARP
jgi:xylulokinase